MRIERRMRISFIFLLLVSPFCGASGDTITPEDALIQNSLSAIGTSIIEYQRVAAWMMVCKETELSVTLKNTALVRSSKIVNNEIDKMGIGRENYDIDKVSEKISSWMTGYRYGYYDSSMASYMNYNDDTKKRVCDLSVKEGYRLIQQ